MLPPTAAWNIQRTAVVVQITKLVLRASFSLRPEMKKWQSSFNPSLKRKLINEHPAHAISYIYTGSRCLNTVHNL